MAKINSLVLRKANGKLAGTTLYTTEGVTIMREVNEKPKNPQTDAQMAHRVKLSNLVNGYRMLRPWILQAFPKGKALNSFYNTFVSKNLTGSPIYLPKDVAKAGKFVPANYVVATGSLDVPVINTLNVTENSISLRILPVAPGFIIDGNTTMGALSHALLDANPTLMQGDQIALIAVEYMKNNGVNVMASQSFVVDTEDERLLNGVMVGVALIVDSATLVASLSGVYTDDLVLGAYAVASRRSGSGIEVTSAVMQTNQNSAFTSPLDLAKAIETYRGADKNVALDPKVPEIIVK